MKQTAGYGIFEKSTVSKMCCSETQRGKAGKPFEIFYKMRGIIKIKDKGNLRDRIIRIDQMPFCLANDKLRLNIARG